MSLDRLLQSAVDSGKWAQCAFCKRALPTEAWKKELSAPGTLFGEMPNPHIMPETINANGYCTHCVASDYDKTHGTWALTERDPEATATKLSTIESPKKS
jgi:hypothetical protein